MPYTPSCRTCSNRGLSFQEYRRRIEFIQLKGLEDGLAIIKGYALGLYTEQDALMNLSSMTLLLLNELEVAATPATDVL